MYTIHHRVGIRDVGTDARLTLGAAAELLLDCSYFQVESEREFYRFLQEEKVGMFLASRQMDILSMPSYGTELDVTTSVYDCRNVYGYRNTMIRDGNGKLCIASHTVGAFVSMITGRPLKLPEAVRDTLIIDPQAPEMEYLPRKVAVPEGEGIVAGTFRVDKYQIDLNHHLNSSQYIISADRTLPPDFTYDRIRVDYKAQARPGEEMTVRHWRSGTLLTVAIEGAAGRRCAVVEFSTRG